MLTSFFSKSNPINFLLLSIVVVLVYILGVWIPSDIPISLASVVSNLFFMVLSVFGLFLLDFIVKKNDLTRQNTYAVLCFVCFLAFFPNCFGNHSILIANTLLLFALRRIFSLYSEKNTEKKILDATIYISIASFFYFFSLLIFIVLALAILRKKHTTFKHLLIPIAGFFAIFSLVTSYYFLTEGSFNWFFLWKPQIGFEFTAYNMLSVVVALAILATFMVWTVSHRLIKLGTISKKDRPNYLLIVILLGVTVLMALASPQKTGAELLFIFAPLAIMVANFVEQTKEFWFKELLLWLLVLAPLFLFLL